MPGLADGLHKCMVPCYTDRMPTHRFTHFSSDLHLGHQGILGHRGFDGTLDDHDTAVIDAFNAVVGPDDHTLLLGDIVMGNRVDNLPLVNRLNGRLTLVPGNHDHNHPSNPRRVTKTADYVALYASYFDAVLADGLHDIAGLGTVQLSHFPFTGDHGDVDRFPDFRPVPVHGVPLLHGHVHGRFGGSMVNGGLDVGIDAHGGAPVTLARVRHLLGL